MLLEFTALSQFFSIFLPRPWIFELASAKLILYFWDLGDAVTLLLVNCDLSAIIEYVMLQYVDLRAIS